MMSDTVINIDNLSFRLESNITYSSNSLIMASVLLILFSKRISEESLFLAEPSDKTIYVGGYADFLCATRPGYTGYRGWTLTRPNEQSLLLTNGEDIADLYSEQMDIHNEMDSGINYHFFYLRVFIKNIDDMRWAGVYSCYVNKLGVFQERKATLTVIGEFCGDVMRL